MDPAIRRLLAPGCAEIIRASQKDTDFVNKLTQNVQESVQMIFGQRASLNWQIRLAKLSTFLYHSLTNLAGYQTLGEEYCGILQVDESGSQIPGKLKLSAMILLTTFGYSTLEWVTNALSITVFNHYLPLFGQLHLAVFYLQGTYYHFSKRLLGIQYLLVRRSFANEDADSQRTLKYLMWISVINSVLTCVTDSIVFFKNMEKQQESFSSNNIAKKSTIPDTEGNLSRRCTLCLDQRVNTGLTPCGHLFCWDCIIDWLRSKQECPICREKFSPSRVVPLQNYF